MSVAGFNVLEIYGETEEAGRKFQHGELFPEISVLDNLLTARHARIGRGPIAEMLLLPSVRRAEIHTRGCRAHPRGH